jgi:hypothetical protein
VVEKVTAKAGCWNVLVVAGSTAEEVAEFIVLSAEAVCCVVLLEAAHTSDPSFDPAMILFASFQAQWLNVHVDFPLLQRLTLPITIGAVRCPGIKLHDPRVIRLLEVLLHNGSHLGGWFAKQIHQTVISTFQLSDRRYGINQLRYDLRKLKGHGLLPRDESRYTCRLSPKASRSRCCFSSSTNGSAARSPTAAFTTAQSHVTSHRLTFAATTRLLHSFGQRSGEVESKNPQRARRFIADTCSA